MSVKHSIIFLFLLASVPSQALESHPPVDTRYHELAEAFTRFTAEAGPSRIRLFEESARKGKMAFTSQERKQKAHYLKLKEELAFWEAAAALKQDLLQLYARHQPSLKIQQDEALKAEAETIAYTLIDGIGRLRRQYGIHTFPLVHNLMINTGLKKRGACKDWAEDLLTLLQSVPRSHFEAVWGEARPQKMLEHNVAVLLPRGAAFEEGLLIDPWRTAGKPFWIEVKKDHYPWKQWLGYEPGRDVQ